MRLDFKLLWIDDQPNAIRSSIDRLSRHIREHGFHLDAEPYTNVTDAVNRLGDGVFADQIDLVLVDYDLGKAPHGDVGLRELRERMPYKEIIFYSSKPAADLRTLAHEQGVEGVYCSSRDDLVMTASRVFEVLTKKVLDLDHSRGIVMGATSDIDHVVHDILVAIHEQRDEAGRKRLLDAALERVEDKIKRTSDDSGKARSEDSFEKVLAYHDLVTSADKIRILIRELKSDSRPGIGPARDMLVAYLEKVTPERNLLAHVRMQLDPKGIRVLRGKNGRELTQTSLTALRRALLDHRTGLFDLAKIFGVGSSK